MSVPEAQSRRCLGGHPCRLPSSPLAFLANETKVNTPVSFAPVERKLFGRLVGFQLISMAKSCPSKPRKVVAQLTRLIELDWSTSFPLFRSLAHSLGGQFRQVHNSANNFCSPTSSRRLFVFASLAPLGSSGPKKSTSEPNRRAWEAKLGQ